MTRLRLTTCDKKTHLLKHCPQQIDQAQLAQAQSREASSLAVI